MASVQQAYNQWAAQYDTNENKTRDLEALALLQSLQSVSFSRCLEIGCGTGKNTQWLVQKADCITAVDLSEEMLSRAREKFQTKQVVFLQADITKEWSFVSEQYDLITFSLVLEHIENIDHVFQQASARLETGGYIYIGELHPFKQYTGSKARFETDKGIQVVTCYNHHLSEFAQAARRNGLLIEDLNEFFDNGDKAGIPRILTMLLKKA